MKLWIYLLILGVLFFAPTIALDDTFIPHIDNDNISDSSTMDKLHAMDSNGIYTRSSSGKALSGGMIPKTETIKENQTLTGIASYYDYTLDGYGERSKSHSTCAFHHQKKTYKMYRVTNLDNGKSVDCYNNDYMARPDRLVDLSSYGFRQIGSTRAGLLRVSVEPIE